MPDLRIPFVHLEALLTAALVHLGLPAPGAALSARLFAETTRDGVYTHGVNRFLRLAAMIRNGQVDPSASPALVASFGSLERWNGQRGVGNLNAYAAMDRAITLARQSGIAAVALGNTNHWMRGGSYGWQAADAGLIGLCWTNTLPNLPAWGTARPMLGNNPFILAVPRPSGQHIVLDMAASQFSYGTLAAYSRRGLLLPVPGGYDPAGNLTTDPAAIEASQRALPVGYWKGSGLALALDMIASMLSGGLATHQIPSDPLRESGLSQVFVAIAPSTLASLTELDAIAEGILASLHSAPPLDPARPVRYPGEETLRLREENLRLGIPIDADLLNQLERLAF